MKRTIKALIGVAWCAALGWQVAAACGDKVAALGGGVPFERLQATRLTGQVIVLESQNSVVQAVEKKTGLTQALTQAGHRVRVVDRVEQLETELLIAPPNVVIADRADLVHLTTSLKSLPAPPALLVAVPMEGATGTANTPANSCIIRANLKHSRAIVRSVDSLVAEQARGKRVECPSTI